MNVVRAVCARALPALTSLDSRHPRLTHEGLWAVAGLTSLGGLGRGNRTCRCVLSERPISESPEGAEGAPPWCRLVVSAAHLRRKDTRVVVVAQPTFSRPATRPGELRLGSPTRRRRRQRPKATAARKSVILMKRSEIKAPVSFRLVEDAGTPQDASRWSTPPPTRHPRVQLSLHLAAASAALRTVRRTCEWCRAGRRTPPPSPARRRPAPAPPE
jgi:hypothetical protein